MKLQSAENPIRTNVQNAPSDFTIANDPIAFDILSNKLYTNKIKAVIREICCNAWDAHQVAGTQDQNFFVHLPTLSEPFFSVRDYGTGIAPSNVPYLVTCYFGSDKRHTNAVIGGLGLGMKCPFAYGHSFTVIDFYEGLKYTYSCYKNEQLKPVCQLISEEPTEEPNGLEVIVPTKVTDEYSFKYEAQQLLPLFDNVTCNYTIPSFTWIHHDEEAGWGILKKHTLGVVNILQGNVIYTVNYSSISNHSKLTHFDGSNLGNNFVFLVPIGTLAVAANREHLSLDPMTFQKLGDIIDNKYRLFKTWVQEQVDNAPTKFAALQFLNQLKAEGGFRHLPRMTYQGEPLAVSKYYEQPLSERMISAFQAKEGRLFHLIATGRHKTTLKLVNCSSERSISCNMELSNQLYYTEEKVALTQLKGYFTPKFDEQKENTYIFVAKNPELRTEIEDSLAIFTLKDLPTLKSATSPTLKTAHKSQPVQCRLFRSGAWEHHITTPGQPYFWLPLHQGKIAPTGTLLDRLLNEQNALRLLIATYWDCNSYPLIGIPTSTAKCRRPDAQQLKAFAPAFLRKIRALWDDYNPKACKAYSFHHEIRSYLIPYLGDIRDQLNPKKPLAQYLTKVETYLPSQTKSGVLEALIQNRVPYLLNWPAKIYEEDKWAADWIKEFKDVANQYPILNFINRERRSSYNNNFFDFVRISAQQIEAFQTYILYHDTL